MHGLSFRASASADDAMLDLDSGGAPPPPTFVVAAVHPIISQNSCPQDEDHCSFRFAAEINESASISRHSFLFYQRDRTQAFLESRIPIGLGFAFCYTIIDTMSRRASPSFIPDEDSRTASFSNKRRQPSRATTPRLESDEEQQHKRQRTEGQTHSFRGASTDFTNHGPTLDSPNMASPASEKSHGLASAVPAKPMIPAMSWNRGRSSGIRATLGPRPGAKKSATTTPQPIPRLAMTSRGANGDREQDKNSSGGSELTGHSNEVESRPEALNEHAHLNLNTAQENGLLSDGEIDSDADDHIDLNQVSDDDGQIVLNMEQDLQRPMPRDVNDEVDDMTRYSQSDPARQENNHNKMLDLAPTASRSSNIHMGTSSPGVQRNGSSSANVVSRSYEYYQVPPETLRDLNPHDFDEQAKYIFFHMDPHRIDLSLPIKCTNCFGTGHLAVVCPDSQVRWNDLNATLNTRRSILERNAILLCCCASFTCTLSEHIYFNANLQ